MAYKKIPKRTDQERRAYANWLKNPVQAVRDWFKVEPDAWQADALNAIFRDGKDRVLAKSAHGVGKTALDAWVAWISAQCYEDSRVVATAPVQAQLTDVLFPEIGLWHSKMPQKMKDEWVVSTTHVRHKSNPNVWFMVARTSNKPANLQGFHNKNITIIGDEGSGIPEVVFEVMEGALSEAGEEDGGTAKLIVTGNPNFTSGEMYNGFGKNKKLYHRITVTGDPDFIGELGIKDGDYNEEHGFVYLSSRVKKKYVDTMASKYGKDSAIYDVRVRACFPRFADDCVISYADASAAMQLELPPFDKVAHPVTLVVDPARGGAAETAIGWFRNGLCYRLEGHKTARTFQIIELVNRAVLELIGAGLTLKEIIVDEPGQGVGVVDDLIKLNLPVRPYNGSFPMQKDRDPAEDIRLFANRRARDWWKIRLRLEHRTLPLPYCEILLGQLTSVKYTHNKGEKILIESKQDMKDRLGKDASPDRADVIVMGTCDWYQAGAQNAMVTPDDWHAGNDRPQMDLDL